MLTCSRNQDYNITMYCAELVNTATNVVFMWLGLKGIRNCLRYSHPSVFILAYIGYMVVGAGSMAFHTTLKCQISLSPSVVTKLLSSVPDSMQLADELPMIYTTCIMAYAAMTYSKSRLFSIVTAAGLAGVAWGITVGYLLAPPRIDVRHWPL